RWIERGGPPVAAPSDGMKGFGSQLIELSAVRQLGGIVTRDWAESGVIVTIDVPATAFSRA
ncbi:MAG: sensor histidine kinase, partial [Sphingomonas sp.]